MPRVNVLIHWHREWRGCPSDCQLYVLDQETGELAWEEFTEKVVSCKVDAKPGENSRKVDYVESGS